MAGRNEALLLWLPGNDIIQAGIIIRSDKKRFSFRAVLKISISVKGDSSGFSGRRIGKVVSDREEVGK